MWWCLIFDFTFSIFACFSLLLFCFQFPSFFFFFLFSRFCAPHYMCYSWIIYVSASHDSWPKNNSFSLFLLFSFFLFFLFFAVFAVYRTLIWIEIDTEFGWTYHRTELDVDLRRQSPDWSPVGGNKANEGVARLSWMSVTDHREVSVWFEDLQIFRLSYLSLSLTHSFLVNEEIERADIAKCWVSAVGLFPPQRWVKVELQKIVHCLFSWGHRKNKREKENKIGKTKPI